MSQAEATQAGPMVLPQAVTPCLTRLAERRPWLDTLAVQAGEYVVGVRVDTERGREEVETLLGAARRPHLDADVAPHFSVELGEHARGGRPLHLVYRQHEVAARRRSVAPLMLDLVQLLDEMAHVFHTESPVVQGAVLITAERRALLLPARLHTRLVTRRQQFEDHGIELLGAGVHRVSATGGEITVDLLDPHLAEAVRLHDLGDRTLTGAFPIAVWGIPAVGNQVYDLRPAEAVYGAASMIVNRRVIGMRETLSLLHQATTGPRFLTVPDLTTGSASELVRELARADLG